jgi:hypothetical protein
VTDQKIVKKHETVACSVQGWNMSLASIFGSGPKLSIVCGSCFKGRKERVAPCDAPRVFCPHCGKVNVLPVVVV